MLQLKPQQICQPWRLSTAVPHTDSLPAEQQSHYEQCTWKTGPPLYGSATPPSWRQPSFSKASSPQTSLGRCVQNSATLPHCTLSLLVNFKVFFYHFIFLVSVVWHHNHCYFTLSNRLSYKQSAPWRPGISPRQHSYSRNRYTAWKQL